MLGSRIVYLQPEGGRPSDRKKTKQGTGTFGPLTAFSILWKTTESPQILTAPLQAGIRTLTYKRGNCGSMTDHPGVPRKRDLLGQRLSVPDLGSFQASEHELSRPT